MKGGKDPCMGGGLSQSHLRKEVLESEVNPLLLYYSKCFDIYNYFFLNSILSSTLTELIKFVWFSACLNERIHQFL